MAVRIRPDGSVEVDTDEEILRVSKLFSANAKTVTKPQVAVSEAQVPSHETSKTADVTQAGGATEWDVFAESVRDKEGQMKFLNFLRDKDEVTLDDMRKVLGAKNNMAVSGTVAGIVKNAKRARLALTKIVRIKKTGRAPNVVTTYRPGRLLKGAPEMT